MSRAANKPKVHNDLRVVNFSTYTSPKITENKNRDWVNYGDDRDWETHIMM